MTALAAKRAFRAKARATGEARVGACLVATMQQRHEPLSEDDYVARLRVAEIERLIEARFPGQPFLPDARGTEDLPQVLAYLTAAAGARVEVGGWAARWLPWLTDAKVLAEAEALSAKLSNGRRGPRILPSDDAAKLLHLTMQERTLLDIRTIGAADLPKKERKRAAKTVKRERDRERQEQRRREAGVETRAEFLKRSIGRPWTSLGISRATYYRWQRETGPSHIIEPTVPLKIVGDAPVSNGATEACVALAQRDRHHTHHSPLDGCGESNATRSSPVVRKTNREARGPGPEAPAGFQGAEPAGPLERETAA